MVEIQPKEKEISGRSLGYLGPDGTFTQEAALATLGRPGYEDSTLVKYPSIAEIFAAVQRGDISNAVVPFENSTAGPVRDTHEGLQEVSEKIKITEEYILPIVHHLFHRKDTTVGQIEEIRSKDQALMQCEGKLNMLFPNRRLIAIDSTAQAVKDASEDPRIAAIGSSRAAKAQNLTSRMTNIPHMEDDPSNATTFVILGGEKDRSEPTGRDKTTLIITTANTPGSLYHVLEELVAKGINLTKIKSLRKEKGRVDFLINIDGHSQDTNVAQTLDALEKDVDRIRLIGSYPRAEYQKPKGRQNFNMDRAIRMIKKEVENGDSNDDNAVAVFTLPNTPGALLNALRPISQSGIDLTKIDSQPSGVFEEYIFYLAHNTRNVANHERVMQELADHTDHLVLLPRTN